jgi:polar amino acid transport system substrate-binding protein
MKTGMTALGKRMALLAMSMVLLVSIGLAGCGGTQGSSTSYKLVKEGTLTVGSDCDYPPFIYLNGSQPAGFEYELMGAIAQKLGLQLQYLEPQNFDTILSTVASGSKMDVGCSSFTINQERLEVVDFCTPYCDSNQAVVVKKASSYAHYSDLAGKTVGAQSGTTGADWANEFITGATVKTYTQTSDALGALMAGDIEAVIYDAPIAAYHVQSTYTDAKILAEISTAEQYGIAVAKTNPELKDAINKALSELKADGTFDRLFMKYFPDLEPPAIS